jgi:ADP-heptose:LPS heptosyltransferase
LTTPPFEALAKSCPYFNAVEADGRAEGFGGWFGLVMRIRQAKYDRIYDLQTSSRSSAIFYGLQLMAPDWSGIAAGCSLPHRNPNRDHMHTLERQADQLKEAGIWPDAPTEPGQAPPPDLSWILDKAPAERASSGALKRPTVVMIPGGAAHRLDKRWPAEKYGELAKALYAEGYDIVVVGGIQEQEIARKIQRGLSQARDLTGRTDFAAIGLLGARAALVIGNDTGPLHLAAAAGAPTIVLFSKASDPALSAPRGHVTVLQADELAELPVESVVQAARSLRPSPANTA